MKSQKSKGAPSSSIGKRKGRRSGEASNEKEAYDSQNADTMAMLDEIRDIIATGPKSNAPGRIKKAKPSPLAEMPDFVRDMQKRDAARKEKMKRDYKPKPNKDDLLGHYLAQPMPEVNFSKDEMKEKVVLGPYKDTVISVDQKLWMEEYNNEQKAKTEKWEEEKKSGKSSVKKPLKRKHDVAHLVAGANVPPPLPEASSPPSSEKKEEMEADMPPAIPAPEVGGISVQSFAKRYPRLSMNCITDRNFDVSTLIPRSDVWMNRFIEECYDEAYLFTSKQISDGRRRKRCGLDLGALDAFPLIVERILTRVFSSGEMREKVCLEIMVTIESITKAGEAAQLSGTFGTHAKGMKGADSLSTSHESVVADIKIDGGRVPLFAKFLAEELDLDYLALFLQSREVVQADLGLRLADATPQAINEVLHAHPDPPVPGAFSFLSTDEFRNSMEMSKNRTVNRTAEVHGTTFAGVSEGPKHKIVPFDLPRNLNYIVDITMPHAQLVGVEYSRIDWLVSKLVPQCSQEEKRFFADKILDATDKLLEQSNKRWEMILPLHATLPAYVLPAHKGIYGSEGNYYVPLYCLFNVVCEMWKQVPLETKNGFMPSGNAAENLSDLNDIYDNDNALMKGIAKQIADTEIERTEKKAAIMKIDKKKRRLERKWNNGMASADELMELQNLRVALTEERAELTEIESRLDGFEQRQAYLRGGIEDLWVAASSSTEVQEANNDKNTVDIGGSKLAPSRWKEETIENLTKAIAYNEECMRAVVEAGTKFHELGDEIVASVKERLAEEEAKAAEEPKEISVAERLLSIEQEALELAALGKNVAIEIGMEPPKPPAYIEDYLNDKEMAELKRLEQEKELAGEESNLKNMQLEELMMRQFLDEEAFQAAHLARVAAFEQEQARKALLESIRTAATRQTALLVEESVR